MVGGQPAGSPCGGAALAGRGRPRARARPWARLLFAHGGLREAQERFEQAAAAAEVGRIRPRSPSATRPGWRSAGSLGEDVVRLRREAAVVDGHRPRTVGLRPRLRRDGARASHRGVRGPAGTRCPSRDLLDLVARTGRRGSAGAVPRRLGGGVPCRRKAASPTVEDATRAVELARSGADPVAESVALDALYSALMGAGDVTAATESVRRRTELLNGMARNPIDRARAHRRAAHGSGDQSRRAVTSTAPGRWALQFRGPAVHGRAGPRDHEPVDGHRRAGGGVGRAC